MCELAVGQLCLSKEILGITNLYRSDFSKTFYSSM